VWLFLVYPFFVDVGRGPDGNVQSLLFRIGGEIARPVVVADARRQVE
jgi:hypothetical protein